MTRNFIKVSRAKLVAVRNKINDSGDAEKILDHYYPVDRLIKETPKKSWVMIPKWLLVQGDLP